MNRSGLQVVAARARSPSFSRRLVYAASLVLLTGALLADDPRSSLKMVGGRVISVAERPGEGELTIVAVRLAPSADDSRSWELLLAPRAALAEIGFEVEVGDQLKARIFPTTEGPAKVHKVLNLTRHKMVRIRTLFQIPLWDGTGAWQGGPCQGLQVADRNGSGKQPGSRD